MTSVAITLSSFGFFAGGGADKGEETAFGRKKEEMSCALLANGVF
eukprot:CAMPEP_0184666824 /NCGR_PEP_ID=MMETSP0308-20130426/64008_1 /TAXON_ID=38269 /ORGANISM="Gloeochaete witrockiana, Strain SAG 46.84" /LENGTH=44 /DNA_ID= /DNA_START= /DNA_END= /DNA_ORIENTATION=